MSAAGRFERVHRVREIEEELAREEFLACEHVARHAEEAAEAMRGEIERAQKELTETRVQRRVPPHELLTAQTTLESLDRVLAEQRRRARELRSTAEELRAAWERARADERSLERLVERDLAAHTEAERLGEARAQDERAQRPIPSGSAEASGPQRAGSDRSGSASGQAPAEGPARPGPESSPDAPVADEEDPRASPR